MKTALHRFTRRSSPASREGRLRRQSGFGMLISITLAVLTLAAVPVSVAADPNLPESRDDKSSPSSQFLTAYNSMSLADWLNEKGMQAEAADLYAEARNLFGKVAADYPKWQSTVVSFRINYCREALQRLQGSVERKTLSGEREAMEDAGHRILVDPQSGIENIKSKVLPLPTLNFKLQQAALRERGQDHTGALIMYIALLEEYPQESWALKGACRCCLRLGHINMAQALIRKALALPSPDADTNLLAALIDCNNGRYQAALPLLRQSLKQNSACPETHVALGVALTAIGKMQEAQEEMKRALSLNPKLGDAFYNLARLSLRQKPADHDTARVHYQNALRHGAVTDQELDALLAE